MSDPHAHTVIEVPPVFTQDWLDCCGGDFVNNGDPLYDVRVIREISRVITIEVAPLALRDLYERAQCYDQDPSYWQDCRGLVLSARAVMRRVNAHREAHGAWCCPLRP